MVQNLNEDDMLIAEDALISSVQFALHNLLEHRGVSRAEIARRIGVTDARMSQIFSDEPENLTLKTIARLFWAMGEEARITSATLDALIPAEMYADHGAAVNIDLCDVPRSEVIAALLRDIDLTDSRFQLECNDNFVEYELAA